ncbi:hypothetical protein MCOR25_002527 [Pyricularia grisea]|uniref:Uncharacterized protein n=1 Tax=Pyricularia grisea TaxID=148305 RepID=A0A6P8B0Y5_PYRGI|nr:uncharacterized protein PgNI_06842 [Pyricularia grisea]KAI6377545.1 hypothetical protein MCOR25_002527 [Pyricularia grisea]TLD08517.1 hypothetical protein PgNI_06842 [Pyricularia grisea]
MAAMTSFTAPRFPVIEAGRSGYNQKPDDEDEYRLQGRSGYNKGNDDEEEEKKK